MDSPCVVNSVRWIARLMNYPISSACIGLDHHLTHQIVNRIVGFVFLGLGFSSRLHNAWWIRERRADRTLRNTTRSVTKSTEWNLTWDHETVWDHKTLLPVPFGLQSWLWCATWSARPVPGTPSTKKRCRREPRQRQGGCKEKARYRPAAIFFIYFVLFNQNLRNEPINFFKKN
jgi:hypothetical protein